MNRFVEKELELAGGLVSGSKCKKVLKEPRTLFYLTKNLIKPTEAGNSPTMTKEMNLWIQQKLFWGNYLEDIILKGSEELNPSYGEIKTDKRSFQLSADPRYTGNIDGYVGKDIGHVDIIFENKNVQSKTKLPNRQDVLEQITKYEIQVRYYMWFFNAKKGILNLFFNGCTLVQEEIQRDVVWEMDFLMKTKRYMEAIEKNDISLIDWSTIENERQMPFNEITSWLEAEKRGKVKREDWNFGIEI